MKVLYIGDDIEKTTSGADAVNKRNLKLLLSLFGDNLFIQGLQTSDLKTKLSGYIGGLTPLVEKKTLETIKSKDISIVFVSHSSLGRICKTIRKKFPNIKIITFYHNIEIQYAKTYLSSVGLKGVPLYLLTRFNEGLATKCSDVNIVLNNRDKNLLNDLYHIKADGLLPVSYEDQFDAGKLNLESKNNKLQILFVGVAFFANTSGIIWFIDNVLNKIEAELIIVGNGMDVFFKNFQHDKVKVFGFVEDLSQFYYNSDVVIAPIFTGGGMKTKTAEAMMFGKSIVGTVEAFEGYDLVENVHYVFQNENECINLLESKFITSRSSKFNEASRAEFLKNYSNIVMLERLKNILNNTH
ncbi:MAG: glycosyltransferase [Chryseobacterium jejuense]|uniref:glycosyltransferase n=1 Tax=Chryseobacterium jejuense TaxID=445960 RepID=UPI003D0C5EBB